MKDDNKSIFIILRMLVLLIFIIIPPLFRVLFPKDGVGNGDIKYLICTKQDDNLKYNISIETQYENNRYISSTIQYMNNDSSSIAVSDIIDDKNYKYLKSLKSVVVETTEDTITLKINKKTINDNSNEKKILNYSKNIDKQKKYYEKNNYQCESTN